MEQCGEKVEWPAGLSADRASAIIADYEMAIRIGGLYVFRPPVAPVDESTPLQVSQHFGYPSLAADEPEPGQLPLVTGSINPTRPSLAPVGSTIRRRCITLSEYDRMQHKHA